MIFLRWLIRIIVGLAAIIVLAVTGVFAMYSFWERDHLEILRTESEVINTACGEIEYTVVGEGVPYLMIHGTPGGYDQVLIPRRVRPEFAEGQRTIAVSRPGYLRTPLESGRTPAQQADLYAALLDELDIDKVVVYGASGGAPSALQFALRHPERAVALLLVVPLLVDLEGQPHTDAPSELDLKFQDIVSWFISKTSITTFVPDVDPENPRQVAAVERMIASTIPARLRGPGYQNDGVEFRNLNIEDWPLEGLAVPTLLVHGDADTNAPYQGSVRAAERLPNAELVTFEGGNHLIVVTRAIEINDHFARFLDDIAGHTTSKNN